MKTVEIIYRYEADAPSRARPSDASSARCRLDDGNRAFASLLNDRVGADGSARRVIHVDQHDLGLLDTGHGVPKQRPYAAILGCSDARVPIELVFNEGPNDLFVVRVAGNVLGVDVLGSLRYAIDHLDEDLKLGVVLGHSGCGAVSAAVDVFLRPADYLPLAANHVLRSLLDRLLFVVHASAHRMAAILGPDVVRLPGYREALIEASVVTNAALAAHTLQQEVDKDRTTDLRAAYGVYVIATREIWAPRCGSGEHVGLAEPPHDLDAFGEFGDRVMRSDRIASLLERGSD